MRRTVTLLALLCGGCVTGIPDPLPPPPKTEACHIWVRIDNGPWRCHDRERVMRDLCKVTGC